MSGASARASPAIAPPSPPRAPRIDEDAVRKAAKLLAKAKRVLIVCGGGAQDASPEVTLLSSMLQAPVLGYRRGRGVLDSRDPLSVTLPLGRELWGEADAVLSVGSRMLFPLTQWGVDRDLQIVRVDADKDEPARLHKPQRRADRRRRARAAQADRRARAGEPAPAFAPRRDAGAPGQMARSGCRSSRPSSPSSKPSAPRCRRTASSSTR